MILKHPEDFTITMLGVGISQRHTPSVRKLQVFTYTGCVYKRIGDATACNAHVERGWLCEKHLQRPPTSHDVPAEELWRWWEWKQRESITAEEILEEEARTR